MPKRFRPCANSRISEADDGKSSRRGDFSHQRRARRDGRRCLENCASLAAQRELDFVSLARASGILYAAFLPQKEISAPPQSLPEVIAEVFRACGQPEMQASAMLEWCPTELKTSADVVWGPSRPDFELMRRVKHSFDPQNVLAPGRFAGGI